MKKYISRPDFKGSKPHLTYQIIETQTNLVIKDRVARFDVKSIVSKLNNGTGFFGFTPEFFANRIELPNL